MWVSPTGDKSSNPRKFTAPGAVGRLRRSQKESGKKRLGSASEYCPSPRVADYTSKCQLPDGQFRIKSPSMSALVYAPEQNRPRCAAEEDAIYVPRSCNARRRQAFPPQVL